MRTDNIITLFGPPGTGKTYRLIQCVELQMSKDTAPRKIAYLAFTKKAADEAINRVKQQFGIPRSAFPNFRTIHSFAFRQCQIQREQVVNPKAMQAFGREYGVEMSGYYDAQEDDTSRQEGYRKGDRIMFIDGLARVSGRAVEDILGDQNFDFPISAAEIRAVCGAYKDWKNTNSLIDYTDMLEQFVERGDVPALDVVIVDEAQDLSALQWRAVEKIAEHARLVYLAGDDDQAIYRWAGADVDRFINIPGTSRVLDQSYRIPRSVQRVSNDVIHRVEHRRSKEWKPREDEGSVNHVGSFAHMEHLISDGGEWLILSRNKKFLRPWRELEDAPRVRVSTIHAAKGGEADNVVLIPDVTPRVMDWMQDVEGYEDECRVFYVGLTRTRKNLYIMEPVSSRSFDL